MPGLEVVSASPLGRLRFNWGRGRGGGAHLSEFSRECTPFLPSAGPPRAPQRGGSPPPFLAFLSVPGSQPCWPASELKCWGGWRILVCAGVAPLGSGLLETCCPTGELWLGRAQALPSLTLLQPRKASPEPVLGRSSVRI